MKLEDVQRHKKPKRLTVRVSVNVTQEESKFMKENNVSPTAIMKAGLAELMEEKLKK